MRIVFTREGAHHISRHHYELGPGTSPWPDGQSRDTACGRSLVQSIGNAPKLSWAICGDHVFLKYAFDESLTADVRGFTPAWSLCTDCILALVE